MQLIKAADLLDLGNFPDNAFSASHLPFLQL